MLSKQLTSFVTRLVAGAPTRKTRLHDERGNFVSMSRLIRNGPRALGTGFARLALGVRAARPWISYDAQFVLAGFLTETSRVLEFGSGTSTAWYSDHAGSVVSIEDNEGWFGLVSKELERRSNVDYRFARAVAEYTDVPLGHFDLIMVDGSFRPQCVEAAVEHLAPGGIIYLDNSDKGNGGLPGDVPLAKRLLEQFAARRGASVTYFTDFAPTQLFVQQGMLVRLQAT